MSQMDAVSEKSGHLESGIWNLESGRSDINAGAPVSDAARGLVTFQVTNLKVQSCGDKNCPGCPIECFA